jgi:gliding motility-associated-like protein
MNFLTKKTTVFIGIILCLSTTYTVFAQDISKDLIAYFPFDSYPIVDKSGNDNKAILEGRDSTLGCGVQDNALRFDGLTSGALFIGSAVFDNFKTGPFSVSFYFKPSNQGGNATFDILSKRDRCTADSSFSIRYSPSSNQLNVEVSENARNRHLITQRLEFNRCWHHVVITREGTRLALYVNGRLAQVNIAPRRVALNNNAPLRIAGSPCLATVDRKFGGFMDELRIYDRVLSDVEVQMLYSAPDRIANRDTIIFLNTGIGIDARITKTCATEFRWSPRDDVSRPDSANTRIVPKAAGIFKYVLTMKEPQCTSLDTLEVKVVDPNTLDCDKVFLPTAFTPNGDGRNDAFHISNPYAIGELLDFEIVDAWGGKVFVSKDKEAKWDGTFNGKELNTGIFVWKIRYRCKDQELQDFGTVTLLR